MAPSEHFGGMVALVWSQLASLALCASIRGDALIPKNRPPLTRQFLKDIAIVAEQLIMYDMLPEESLWDSSRERAAPFFPDRIAEIEEQPNAENCEVRHRRVAWANALRRERGLEVIDFVDTGVGTEKAAVVMRWQNGLGGDSTIVIAFRGSKGVKDWLFTNSAFVNPRRKVISLAEEVYRPSVKVPAGTLGTSAGPSEALHTHTESEVLDRDELVAVPLGVWRAYAGEEQPKRGKEAAGAEERRTPRTAVRRAVEQLLAKAPATHVVVTGHSLGGLLCQTCALDLIQSLEAVRRTGVVCLPVAAPPAFSRGFQQRMRALQRKGLLRALHLTAAGDFAPKVSGALLGGVRRVGVHGVTPRLVLNPRDTARPMYFVADGEDDDCDDLGRMPFDMYGHNLYAKDLSGLATTGRPQTVPRDFGPWPVPKRL